MLFDVFKYNNVDALDTRPVTSSSFLCCWKKLKFLEEHIKMQLNFQGRHLYLSITNKFN